MDCGICLEKFPADTMKFMSCCHCICQFCYNSLQKQECPYCRTSFENDISSDIDDDTYFQMVPIEEERRTRRRKKKKKKNFRYNLRNNETTVVSNAFEMLNY